MSEYLFNIEVVAYVVNLEFAHTPLFIHKISWFCPAFLHPIDKDSREGGEGDKEDWIDLFVARVEG